MSVNFKGAPFFVGRYEKSTRMKVAAIVSVVVASFVSTESRADGPFGISMGIDASTLPGCSLSSSGHPGMYLCKSVPKPHPDIEEYFIFSPRDVGICRIVAVGRDISDSGNGGRTRQKTDEIAAQIATSYGQWTKRWDFLHVGALFTEDVYWLMAVRKDERTYGYVWSDGNFASKNAVKELMVTAKASKSDTGYVSIQFDFSNRDKCDESKKKSEGAVF